MNGFVIKSGISGSTAAWKYSRGHLKFKAPKPYSIMRESETTIGTEFPHTASTPESPVSNFSQDAQDMFDKVNRHIESAHHAKMQGNTKAAIQSYLEVLRLIEQIQSFPHGQILGSSLQDVGKVKEMQEEISLLKVDVSRKLQMLKSGASHSKSQKDEDESPKLSDASNSDEHYFLNFDFPKQECSVEATEIFTIPNGVLMFSISAEGIANASSKWQTLHTVKFGHGSKKLSNGAFIPPAFLQVGDWLYPLMPGLSPALITKFGTYIFPDVLSDEEGAAVAIVLSKSVPKIERLKFEVILDHFTVLENKHIQKSFLQDLSDMDAVPIQEPMTSFNIASIISFIITVAASLTAWVVTTGAFLIIWLVQLAFRLIRSNIEPAQAPRTVHPNIRQGVTYVKTATTATVRVKQYVVDKLGESTMSLALTIAPIIKEQGEKVLQDILDSPSNQFVRGTMQITSSTIKGMTRVFKSVDNASISVMGSLTRESFEVIHHRFGDDVGSFASETLSTAQCMVRTARSARDMNLMRFAVRAGKPQGRAVLQDHAQSIDGARDVITVQTPAVFVKANAILHNSTQRYVKILETIGRSKLDLRRRSDGSSEEVSRLHRRASVDGVIRPKTGKMAPYFPVHAKNKHQGKRFSFPASAGRIGLDVKQLRYVGHKSAHNLLSKVVSVNEAASNISTLDHMKSTNEKFQAKYQAIAEDAATKMAQSDLQSKIDRRKGSLNNS